MITVNAHQISSIRITPISHGKDCQWQRVLLIDKDGDVKVELTAFADAGTELVVEVLAETPNVGLQRPGAAGETNG
jgi:D-alanine-D-alanine ligase-like ATP-grasp enzyme